MLLVSPTAVIMSKEECNMNHKFSRILSILALVGVLSLSGCVPTTPADDDSRQDNHDANAAWTAEGENASEQLKGVLAECMALMDKDDAETMTLLGGGRENRTEDGQFLLGRVYEVNVFGEPTQVFTVYDDDGSVCCVTMRLKSSDVTMYQNQLRALYGDPVEGSEKPTEKGVTWSDWQIDQVRMILFEKGDCVVLEMRRQVEV